MNIEQLRDYCLSKKGAEESFPFDDTILVFKVGGKMFLLTSIESRPLSFNVKCDPEKAIALREEFPFVIPAFHMNKKHWNSIIIDGSVKDKQICQWIDESYDLIVAALPRKKKI